MGIDDVYTKLKHGESITPDEALVYAQFHIDIVRRANFLEAGLLDIVEAWKYQDPDKMRDIAKNALRRANR